MSLEGQVLWNRRLVVCAVDTMGAAVAPAPTAATAALRRKRRRCEADRVIADLLGWEPPGAAVGRHLVAHVRGHRAHARRTPVAAPPMLVGAADAALR